MNPNISRILKNFYFFLCILLTLSAVYFPAISGHYAHNDDYLVLNFHNETYHPISQFLTAIGRWGQGFVTVKIGECLNSIEDLKAVRFLSVFVFSLCAWHILSLMRNFFSNLPAAFLFVVTIFTLPSFQVLVSNAAFISVSIAVLLALWAGILALKTSTATGLQQIMYSIFAFLALFCSLFIYQTSSMFYWVIVALIVLVKPVERWNDFRNQMLTLFGIGLGTIGVYGIVLLGFLKKSYYQYTVPGYNPYIFATDYLQKLRWFLNEGIFLNLWNIFPNGVYAKTVISFIVLSCLFAFFKALWLSIKRTKKAEFAGVLIKAILVFFLFLLSGLPQLIGEGYPNFYRTSPAPTGMVVVIFLWSIYQWILFLPRHIRNSCIMGALFIVCFYGMFQANRNIWLYRVLPSTVELRYYTEKIKQLDLNKYKKVYVLRPPQQPFLGPFCWIDEVSCFSGGSIDLIRTVFEELGRKAELQKFSPAIVHVTEEEFQNADGTAYLIDARKLYDFNKDPRIFASPKIPYFALMLILLVASASYGVKNFLSGYKMSHFCWSTHQTYLGYSLIVVNIFLLYLMSVRYSFLYHEAYVPRGDPFTYTINFFTVLDLSHTDYWKTLFSVFSINNWYWLINGMIAVFSPFLIKEPYSIALVNFIIFGLAQASLFRLARHLQYSVTRSYVLSLVIWFFPSNYGFEHPVSLLQMQLDTAFLFAVTIGVANTLIYALNPGQIKNALWAGIAVGVAAWGRGNSLPYIMISIFYPMVMILQKIWREQDPQRQRDQWMNFLVFLGLLLFFIGIFYFRNYGGLMNYYSGVTARVAQNHINFVGVLTYLNDIPGRFFCHFIADRKAFLTTTILCHGLILLSLGLNFFTRGEADKDRQRFLRIISVTGAVIFYGVFLFTILLFNATALYVLHIFPIMLVGLSLAAFSLLAAIMTKTKFSEWRGWLFFLSFLAVLYGVHFTKQYTPLQGDPSAATPQEVERFSKNIDKILKGRSLAILWYEHYNGPIINYYRIKNDLPWLYNLYAQADYFKYLWTPPYSSENIENIRATLRTTFEKADFFIIPEFSDHYFKYEPYPLFQRSDDIVDYLNSSQSPRLVVRMVLHDTRGIRLLLLQKEEEAVKEGVLFEPLKLPYGSSGGPGSLGYSSVPSDKVAIK